MRAQNKVILSSCFIENVQYVTFSLKWWKINGVHNRPRDLFQKSTHLWASRQKVQLLHKMWYDKLSSICCWKVPNLEVKGKWERWTDTYNIWGRTREVRSKEGEGSTFKKIVSIYDIITERKREGGMDRKRKEERNFKLLWGCLYGL